MRETVQKARMKQQKKYTQLNDVYLKLNLSSKFMGTNQHICASTRSPLIMSVSRSIRPLCFSRCVASEKNTPTKEETEKNILSHQHRDRRRSMWMCVRPTCAN